MTGSPAEVAAALRARQSFILTSHARPDGDAIGSQLALGLALEALGKRVRFVDKDPAPAPYRGLPGVDRLELTSEVRGDADAVVVLECGDLSRTEVAGFDRYFVVNIDHHLGNTMYGAVNWFELSAAACAEMVASIIDALGVAWTTAIAQHLYLGIVTDTGGFHHSHISARTFDLSRRIVEAGVDASAMARQIFDSFSVGRLKITGALLNGMELHHDGRLALLYLDDAMLAACGATLDDADNLVNLPLGAKDVVASVLFKRQSRDALRLSLRSKGAVDVRSVAARWGGGGHVNAAGCTIAGSYDDAKRAVVDALGPALDA